MNAMDALKYGSYMGQGLSSLYGTTAANSAPGSDSLKSMYSSAESSHGTSLSSSGML